MAAVATKPELIRKLCVEVKIHCIYDKVDYFAEFSVVQYDEKVGVYGFIFCRDGDWVDVIIDE